jgi:hypothetical protein
MKHHLVSLLLKALGRVEQQQAVVLYVYVRVVALCMREVLVVALCMREVLVVALWLREVLVVRCLA